MWAACYWWAAQAGGQGQENNLNEPNKHCVTDLFIFPKHAPSDAQYNHRAALELNSLTKWIELETYVNHASIQGNIETK